MMPTIFFSSHCIIFVDVDNWQKPTEQETPMPYQPFCNASQEEAKSLSFLGHGRGAPIKWPFLSMAVGDMIKVEDSSEFASARAAAMYAKKSRGYRIRTRIKDGVLFVKRFQ